MASLPTARELRVGDYRELLQQLQSEFARVVAALEARARSLQRHNDALTSDVSMLREQLTAREHEASEREQMLREETASKLQVAAATERQLQTLCEQLTLQLQRQQEQWDAERLAAQRDRERAERAVADATAKLANEQKSNAHMSQEIQLLQCRVDAAVKTSRSFEARLEKLKQLKKDEKNDLEAQVAHLKTRLEDKKEQNRYLAEALMDREARRAARKEKEQRASDVSSTSYKLKAKTSEPELRRRETTMTKEKPTSRYQLPTFEEKHHLKYHGSPLSSLLEDLHSHAPTSPTSSTSPTRSPRSTVTTPRTVSPRPTASSLSAERTAAVRTSTKITTRTSSRSAGSERLQRELDQLRRKFDACMHNESAESLSPH